MHVSLSLGYFWTILANSNLRGQSEHKDAMNNDNESTTHIFTG